MALDPKNEVYGDFGLPARAREHRQHALAALAVASSALLLAAQLTTQWLARRLVYQPALGQPLATIRDVPLYLPWRALTWMELIDGQPGGDVLAGQASQWLRFGAIFALTAGVVVFARRARSARNRSGELHGSARWAKREDIKAAGLFATSGVVLGKWVDAKAKSVRYLRHDGPEHILTFAPTGSGKGVGLVIPTLLSWTESTLVLDPKGENFAKTSGYRKSLGHRVYKLDFSAAPEETAAFNPLDAVRIQTPYETADVQRIARLIVDPDGKQFEGANKHWAETAASLLTGTILHVLYRERLKNKSANLAQVVAELSSRTLTHRDVLIAWQDFEHDPTKSQGWRDDDTLKPIANHPIVAAVAREQLNREEKERAAVLSSAITPLSLFRDPLLATNTARSDFRIEDLMDAEKPIAVYLVLRPSDIQRLRPIVRIVLDMAIRRLVETMTFEQGRVTTTHKHKLLLMLDEFPVLGKLEIMTEALAYIRGWGIKAFLITQDYEQLRESYGDRETISSNCPIKLAFAPNKYETAKQLSSLIGTMTALKRSHSQSSLFGALAQRRDSESDQEVARPLLNPDECMRLPGARKQGDRIVEAGDMLVLHAGCYPIYAKQPLYFRDSVLAERAEEPPAPVRPAASRAAPSAPSSATPAQATPASLAAAATVPAGRTAHHLSEVEATAPSGEHHSDEQGPHEPADTAGNQPVLGDELYRIGLGGDEGEDAGDGFGGFEHADDAHEDEGDDHHDEEPEQDEDELADPSEDA